MHSSYIFYVVLLLVTAHGRAISRKKKVCVIGAGMAGLASVKRLAEHTDEFEPVVFEKNSDVGGQWIYTDSITVDEHGLPVHSSIYENLRSNVPKELIAWPDYRNFTDDEHSSVPHYLVLQYLRNYTAHFNLRQYIQLDTLVENISSLNDSKVREKSKWMVKTRNLNTQKTEETICDAVMVCNGHFTKENIPRIPGTEKFQGTIIHSHLYRKPEVFANKTVAILGASISGVDIAVDVSSQAKKIFLSHRNAKITSTLPSNIEQVPGIVAANDGNELVLSNKSSIIVDAFIYCTGYSYDFPFLDESCGIKIIRKTHVFPLYKHMINAEHPTMAFIGLTTATSIFLLPYVQSQYFVALLQGKVQLPSYDEMIKDANSLPPGAGPGKYHALDDNQWSYNRELAKAAGFKVPPSYYEGGLHLYESYRDAHLGTFREILFRFNPDGTFRLVDPKQNNVSNTR